MKIRSRLKVVFTFLLIFSFISCETSKSTKDESNKMVQISKVVVEKVWMGGNERKEITDGEISKTSMVRGGEATTAKRATDSKKWNQLTKLMANIDLNEMQNWEGPTQKRFYDGAKGTTITIESNGEEFISQSFDEGEPPAQLKEIYDYLESL
jgi:hypothetical protein